MNNIIMVIDGHNMHYTGDGWKWNVPEGQAATWSDLKRVPYTQKTCSTCGFVGMPNEAVRPCNELWSDRVGKPS